MPYAFLLYVYITHNILVSGIAYSHEEMEKKTPKKCMQSLFISLWILLRSFMLTFVLVHK